MYFESRECAIMRLQPLGELRAYSAPQTFSWICGKRGRRREKGVRRNGRGRQREERRMEGQTPRAKILATSLGARGSTLEGIRHWGALRSVSRGE